MKQKAWQMARRRYWIFVFLFFLSTINYVDRVTLSVAATPIAAEFGLSTVQLGYLFSSFLWLYVVCLIPMGIIVDRLGSRTVNALGMALWSAATVATGFAGSFVGVLLSRIVMGVGEATTYPTAGRVIREWVPSRERGVATTIFNSGASFGPAIAGLLMASLIGAIGWRTTFFVCGAIGFVWLAAWLRWFRLPEQVSWLDTTERQMLLAERDAEIGDFTNRVAPISIGRLLAQSSMWGLMISQGCATYANYLFLTWLPNYLQVAKGLTVFKSGTLMALPYLGAAVFAIILGRVSDIMLSPTAVREGRRRLMIVIAMLSSSVILFIPLLGSVYAILLLIMISLAGVSTSIALNIALVSDLMRSPSNIGRATGILIFGGNIFGLLAPIVTGYVIEISGGYGGAFVIAGVLQVSGALATFLLTRRPLESRAWGNDQVTASIS
jgi:MFS family permease